MFVGKAGAYPSVKDDQMRQELSFNWLIQEDPLDYILTSTLVRIIGEGFQLGETINLKLRVCSE